jgi:hypothetical protein
MIKLLVIVTILFSFLGCENKAKSTIAKVHWDRDMCANCEMVISDRHNAVQVHNPKTKKVYMFDDIGCMATWFKDQNIKWKDRAIIWIKDLDSGKWINARTAFYDTKNLTPMAYGFSAHISKDAIKKGHEIIDYKEVLKRVNHGK